MIPTSNEAEGLKMSNQKPLPTKSEIITMLLTDDKAVGRALVALTARQTADEKRQEETKYLNGEGFRPCHARMGTSMGEQFRTRGFLSPKQIAYWRYRTDSGKTRIEIYAGQLLEIAKEKAERKAAMGK